LEDFDGRFGDGETLRFWNSIKKSIKKYN
jgi:hypothetical protein